MSLLTFIFKERRNKSMKKIKALAVVSAVALALSSCGANGDLKKVAIEVGNAKITAGSVAVMAETLMEYSGSDFETAVKNSAEQIKMSFEYSALAKAMKIELTEEEKAQAVSTRAQYATNNGGYDAYSKYLEKNASSVDFLDDLFTSSMYVSKVQEEIQKEFEDKDASDDELKKFYDENFYRAKHILINIDEDTDEKAAEAKAKELLEKAKNGEDFDTLVKENSEDPGSESNPDGYVFTDGQMVEEFENTVKSLKSGEFGICKSTYGYHVILRLDLPEFEDHKSTVSSSYESKRVENRVEELLKENNIESRKYDDVIDNIKEDMLSEAPKKEENTSVEY